MKRESFIFYRSFYESAQSLKKNEKQKFYDALFQYALNGEEIELTGAAAGMFKLLKPQLDANNRRYENGCKGGKPKRNQNVTKSKPNANQNVTKTEPNDNDNVNDNDNDNGFGSGEPNATPAEMIAYLNEKSGGSCRMTENNLALAADILQDYKPSLIKAVIDNKVAMWGSDEKMAAFLRPKTLFNRDNFENYLDEPDVTGGE